MAERIVREFLQATGGDWRAAIYRMASIIEVARDRVDDAGETMGRYCLAQMKRDLHPLAPTNSGDA